MNPRMRQALLILGLLILASPTVLLSLGFGILSLLFPKLNEDIFVSLELEEGYYQPGGAQGPNTRLVIPSKFTEPHKFYGQSLVAVAEQLDATIAETEDRLTAEDETFEFYAQTEGGNAISYIELSFNEPRWQCEPEDTVDLISSYLLGLAGVYGEEWLWASHSIVRYRIYHLPMEVFCPLDGGQYTISIGTNHNVDIFQWSIDRMKMGNPEGSGNH